MNDDVLRFLLEGNASLVGFTTDPAVLVVARSKRRLMSYTKLNLSKIGR